MVEQNNCENGMKLLDSKEQTSTAMEYRPVKHNRRSGTSWWKRRSSLEKTLIMLLCVVFAAMLVAVVVLKTRSSPSRNQSGDSSGPQPHTTDNPGICITPSCVTTAARLMEAMNTDADPCDDFFEYACGAWNRKHVIPDDRPNYNTFRKLGDELRITLKSLLEAPVTQSETYAIQNAKYLYQSCLNTSTIERRQDAPLRELLESLGGWPVLDSNWNQSNFDVTVVMAKLRLLNNRVLVDQWVSPDDKNSEVNVIQIDQARLGMPSRDYFLRVRNDSTLMAYQDFAIELAKLMSADPTIAERDMAEMVDFEIALANITVPEDQRRDTEAIYNKVKLYELYNFTQEVDWQRYMDFVFANVSLSVNASQDIVLYAPDYLVRLGALLSQTPKRVIANYMVWRIAMNRVGNMPQSFIDVRRKFFKALHGTDREQERWSSCVNFVNEHFGMAVGRMFIEEHFDENSKSDALDMIHQIRASFIALLDEVPWMDNATRAVAREKAMSIQEKIGYPDYITNDTALNEDYQESTMLRDRYFENVLTILNVATRNTLKNIVEPVDRNKWSTAPAVVNAFYSSTKNQIMFPAGIFQSPFYRQTYPKSLNFGGIGMVIGHEITHGFDDKGRQYDKDGNLRQWWSASVIDRFKEQARCIIEQYGNYTVPEVNLNLNGVFTQGENIADNGGLKQAFSAYRTWVAEQGQEEPSLPGLSLTHNQLFFLNFAQIWCGTARPQNYLQAIRSGRHSPGRYRVIGPLSNSQEFATAYNCPLGSRMNPRHKCAVW